jgi:transcriptional regulator with XRE-family HTH domain
MVIDGEKVRAARHRNAWTQRELGQRAGLTFSTICRIENGQQNPHPTTVRKLAAVLGVKPEELLASKPKPHPLQEPGTIAHAKATDSALNVPARSSPHQGLTSAFP